MLRFVLQVNPGPHSPAPQGPAGIELSGHIWSTIQSEFIEVYQNVQFTYIWRNTTHVSL